MVPSRGRIISFWPAQPGNIFRELSGKEWWQGRELVASGCGLEYTRELVVPPQVGLRIYEGNWLFRLSVWLRIYKGENELDSRVALVGTLVMDKWDMKTVYERLLVKNTLSVEITWLRCLCLEATSRNCKGLHLSTAGGRQSMYGFVLMLILDNNNYEIGLSKTLLYICKWVNVSRKVNLTQAEVTETRNKYALGVMHTP